MLKSQKALLILLILLIVLAGTATYAWKRIHQKPALVDLSTPTVTTPQTPSENPNDIKIDPGTNYDLFASDTLNPDELKYPDYVQYRDLADISSGQYAGYHHVLAFVTWGPGGPAVFSFVTKDFKTFLIDSNQTENLEEPGDIFNKQKVVGSAAVATNFLKEIDLGNFVYVRGIPFEDAPSMKQLHQIDSQIPGLTFYNQDSRFITYTYPNGAVPADVKDGDTMAAFAADVVVTDGTGLFYNYVFRTKEMYDRQKKGRASQTYDTDYADFYIEKEFTISEPHYSAYGDLFPGGCGAFGATYALNGVTDSDFVEVGKTNGGVVLYKPKDIQSPLNKTGYHHKVSAFHTGNEYDTYYLEMNKLKVFPSYEEYVSKDPVLVFKDSFGRWIGVGEYEYQLPGGCGKPVVYLYPTIPTNVSVSFETPVIFDRAIPFYANGWNVTAYPDGTLKDLQSSATNCSAINYILPGAEYAKTACPSATYPYLYWSGNTANAYPKQNTGWIVEKKNVASFLESKLSEMGLSEKEKDDMTSYWVPALLAKNAPYYRMAFIQTQEMNAFIPMNVTPTPDTTFRIFLDWEPLVQKPTAPLLPEKLDHLNRTGFTLVEWGGLRQ